MSVACVKCEKIRLFSGSGFTLRNICSRNCFAASGSFGGPVKGCEVGSDDCEAIIGLQGEQTFVSRKVVG